MQYLNLLYLRQRPYQKYQNCRRFDMRPVRTMIKMKVLLDLRFWGSLGLVSCLRVVHPLRLPLFYMLSKRPHTVTPSVHLAGQKNQSRPFNITSKTSIKIHATCAICELYTKKYVLLGGSQIWRISVQHCPKVHLDKNGTDLSISLFGFNDGTILSKWQASRICPFSTIGTWAEY